MLSGSIVSFKKLERPPLSEEERVLKLENERQLQGGITILRKLRTRSLAEQDLEAQQEMLREAHGLSAQMAEAIMDQSLGDKPSPIAPAFLKTLDEAKDKHAGHEADSGHGIPPQFSIQNLFRAADDMLVRIKDTVQSFEAPDRKLTQDELKYVIREFLRGTNDLTINAIEKFFDKDTKVGGILSGGSVYLELVKTIVERYGDGSASIDSFVIAVDKDGKRVAVEAGGADAAAKTVIVTDDMIDKGGTLLTALWSVGKEFPNATIYSGLGTDHPGGFEKRRSEKHHNHLSLLYQDFAEFSDEGRDEEALALFRQAEQYAKDNRVELQAGWHKRRALIGKSKV